MSLKIKKLNPEATIPSYALPGDFGLDLTAISRVYTENYIEYDTGIAIELPEGYAGFIMPRSSVSKTGLVLANSIGLVDAQYRGPLKLRFYKVGPGLDYKTGDRIGQLVLVPVPKVEVTEETELSETTRGSGGFGSTGN